MASRTVICALVGVLLVSIVSSDSTRTGRINLFAFATVNELVVMDGEAEIAREDIFYESRFGGIVWSLDGRHASLISDGGSKENPEVRELVSVDTEIGEVRRFNCAYCDSVVPIGESSILVTRHREEGLFPEGILRFDLASGGVPTALAVDDVLTENSSSVRILSGSKEYALAVSLSEEDNFFTIRADGSARRVEPDQPLPVQHQIDGVQQDAVPRGIGETSVVYADDGSPYFAVTSVLNPSAGGCSSSHAVFLVQPESGSVMQTDISDLHIQDWVPTVDGYARILDLWWEINGQLHAVMLSGSCDEISEDSSVPPSVWRLTRGEWEKVDGRTDRIIGMRHLSQNSRLVISGTGDVADLAGDLYIEHAVSRHLIATEVLQVEVPGIRQCNLGGQGLNSWCGDAGGIYYGSPLSDTSGSSPTSASSPTDAPSMTPSPLPPGGKCSSSEFAEYAQDMEYLVGYSDIEAICRGGFAYVQVTGDGPMIYEGTQDLLFSSSSDGWTLLGGGPGSAGQFIGADIEALGLDPHMIDELFPEMDLSL